MSGIMSNPDYSQFFPFALFFTIMHVSGAGGGDGFL